MTKVLVVEDSQLMVSILKNFIRKAKSDVEVIEAHDGEAGVAQYESQKPDLVFMDIKMPKMDGLEALEKIRSRHSSAKVVMCTSLKEDEQEKKAKDLGAVGYIMKPFNSEDIAHALKEHL
ncbi:MAG: response regulator [Nanoarchaeota archaeon]